MPLSSPTNRLTAITVLAGLGVPTALAQTGGAVTPPKTKPKARIR
jgi:hypothetical protein